MILWYKDETYMRIYYNYRPTKEKFTECILTYISSWVTLFYAGGHTKYI